MRINRRESSNNLFMPDRSVNRIEEGAAQSFSELLQQQHAPDWQKNLDVLLNRLDEIGKRLVRNFSVYDLKEYKDLLQGFLMETRGHAYQLREEIVWTRQGRQKKYVIIEQIDQELEELSQLVLNKQKDAVKLLAKLDHIRGLLVDLYS